MLDGDKPENIQPFCGTCISNLDVSGRLEGGGRRGKIMGVIAGRPARAASAALEDQAP
jgi:hypothetical protein